MSKTSLLLLPRLSLAGYISAAIVRDARGCILSDGDRFDHFPASSLVGMIYVFEGEIRPLTSRNAGPVFTFPLGFTPMPPGPGSLVLPLANALLEDGRKWTENPV